MHDFVRVRFSFFMYNRRNRIWLENTWTILNARFFARVTLKIIDFIIFLHCANELPTHELIPLSQRVNFRKQTKTKFRLAAHAIECTRSTILDTRKIRNAFVYICIYGIYDVAFMPSIFYAHFIRMPRSTQFNSTCGFFVSTVVVLNASAAHYHSSWNN